MTAAGKGDGVGPPSMPKQAASVDPKIEGGQEERYRIGDGEGAPRALQPEEARQAPYQRDDQQKLTQHREAKRGDPPPDPLVEPGEKDLEAGEHDAERNEPGARDALGDQLQVVGEDREKASLT